jgi:hypothetical protein
MGLAQHAALLHIVSKAWLMCCRDGAQQCCAPTGGDFGLADSRWARRVVPLRGRVRSHMWLLAGLGGVSIEWVGVAKM